jgi:mannosyltransferase OCH1-like enzyme
MLPKTIHQIWLGGDLPPRLVQARNTIIQTSGWNVKLWTEEEIHTCVCRLEDYNHTPQQYAGQVDIIKLHILKLFGGVALDLDFVGHKSFDPVRDCQAFAVRQPDGTCCNAIMGATRNHPWVNRILADEKIRWGAPHTCYVMEPMHGEDVTIYPTDWFYPYGHDEEPKPPTTATIATHLWEGSWVK